MSDVLGYDDVPRYVGLIASWGCDLEWKDVDCYVTDTLRNANDGSPAILCPDYQRGHVWTAEQQRDWIEFRLSGGMGGQNVYFNEYPTGAIELVDGLQRITAIRCFMAGELVVYRGVKGRDEGWRAGEMDRRIHRTHRSTIRVDVNSLETRAEVLRWYLDMNGGGTPHSPGELARVRGLLAREEDCT